MIIDSSAIIAILNDEPDAPAFARAIEQADRIQISSGTVLEATIVVGRSRRAALDGFLALVAPTVLPVDAEHLEIARGAWTRFGRGSGSPARLNYADCFAYAAAKVTGEPLLFKGDDFIHTDIEAAL